MPVSSPSYFPPSRGTDQIVGITAGRSQTGARVFLAGQGTGDNSTIADLILIGHDVMSGAVTVADGQGSTVYGSSSMTQAVRFDSNPSSGVITGPVTAVGWNNAPSMRYAPASVYMGSRILQNLDDGVALLNAGGNVFLGDSILASSTGVTASLDNNVIIGFNAFKASATTHDVSASVVIGARACENASGTSTAFAENVAIGFRAGRSLEGAQTNTLVGYSSGSTLTICTANVMVGHATQALASASGNVLLGQGVSIGECDNNILIGSLAGASSTLTGDRNVWIGRACGEGADFTVNNSFLLEINLSAGALDKRTLMFGDFETGNIILGNSTQGTNRPLGAGPTNIAKLLNGTIGDATTRVGGGYFYVSAGALHWVGSAGTDTVLAPA